MGSEFVKALTPQIIDHADERPVKVMERNLARLIVTKDKIIRKATMKIVKVVAQNGKLSNLDKTKC
jgi:hypothetical protein